MNEEIKEFVEFRIDEDGTYFYYNDKDNVEQWSYKLDDLKDYIINLQQENARLKDKIENATKLIEEIKLHYQQSPTMIPNVKINKLEDYLKEN